MTAADPSQDQTVQEKSSNVPSEAQADSLAGRTAEVSVDQAPQEAALHAEGTQSLMQQLIDQTLNQCLHHVVVSDSTAA